jgi:hypothetical protein
MTSIYNPLRLGTILIFITLLSGCSLKYSFTGASIPPGAKTFSVAPFPNNALLVNPLLSNTLTEALKDKFLRQTSLIMAQTNGDLSFTGIITDYRLAPIAIQAGSDKAAQNRLTITVKVQFVNNLEPKANFDVQFSQFADYESARNFDEVESGLVTLIVEKLVDDIFTKAVVNW